MLLAVYVFSLFVLIQLLSICLWYCFSCNNHSSQSRKRCILSLSKHIFPPFLSTAWNAARFSYKIASSVYPSHFDCCSFCHAISVQCTDKSKWNIWIKSHLRRNECQINANKQRKWLNSFVTNAIFKWRTRFRFFYLLITRYDNIELWTSNLNLEEDKKNDGLSVKNEPFRWITNVMSQWFKYAILFCDTKFTCRKLLFSWQNSLRRKSKRIFQSIAFGSIHCIFKCHYEAMPYDEQTKLPPIFPLQYFF